MRKTFNQFFMNLFETDDLFTVHDNEIEIITKEGGEELRGGDRPYMPIIYETTTGKSLPKTTTLLGLSGINTNLKS